MDPEPGNEQQTISPAGTIQLEDIWLRSLVRRKDGDFDVELEVRTSS